MPAPCKGRKASTPSAADLLALAQKQLYLLLTGQAPLAIETPQLGRVAFQQTSVADLQRLIDLLQAQVDPATAAMTRRRPISIEACP